MFKILFTDKVEAHTTHKRVQEIILNIVEIFTV